MNADFPKTALGGWITFCAAAGLPKPTIAIILFKWDDDNPTMKSMKVMKKRELEFGQDPQVSRVWPHYGAGKESGNPVYDG